MALMDFLAMVSTCDGLDYCDITEISMMNVISMMTLMSVVTTTALMTVVSVVSLIALMTAMPFLISMFVKICDSHISLMIGVSVMSKMALKTGMLMVFLIQGRLFWRQRKSILQSKLFSVQISFFPQAQLRIRHQVPCPASPDAQQEPYVSEGWKRSKRPISVWQGR
jgi:hypothetical protein